MCVRVLLCDELFLERGDKAFAFFGILDMRGDLCS